MAQDNYEVQFKEELYKRFQICQRRLILKVEYSNTTEQHKLRQLMTLRSHAMDTTYSASKNQFLFVVSYAEHCFLILSVRNLPDI